MAMDDAAWARHASPWSVWTRILTPLPLFALAVWSRVWIGGWAVIPVAFALAWVWLNPRLFPPPATLDSWGAEGVLGERVFLRHRGRVARHHIRPSLVLTALSASGVIPFALGLWTLDAGWVLAGMLLISGAKTWFLDRMVWVWHDFRREGGQVEDLSTRTVPHK